MPPYNVNESANQQIKLLNKKQQLQSTIALYESYTSSFEDTKITPQQLNEKGDQILQWFNSLLKEKVQIINQISYKSIDIFNQVIRDQAQLKSKFLEMEHQDQQRAIALENYKDTVKNLEEKLFERENEIFKQKAENQDLLQKVEAKQIETRKIKKQFKKTMIVTQQNVELQNMNLDQIHLQYEYEKQQNQVLTNDLNSLKDEKKHFQQQLQQAKRLLHAAEKKVEWQLKQKMPMEQRIKDQQIIIDKLQREVLSLKQNYQDVDVEQYDDSEPKGYEQQLYLSLLQPHDQTNLREDMIRQSFTSQNNFDDFPVRKDSIRKSFEDEPSSFVGSETNYDQNQNYQVNVKVTQLTKRSMIKNQNQQLRIKSQNTITLPSVSQEKQPIEKSQKQQQKKQNIKTVIKNQEVDQPSLSPRKSQENNILIKNHQSHEPVASQRNSITKSVPDLYFTHFLLTCQSAKIRLDDEDILHVNVNPYYQQIMDNRVPMHLWDEWITKKLKNMMRKQDKINERNQLKNDLKKKNERSALQKWQLNIKEGLAQS